MNINIIGAGLAGCECAYILAKNNIKVKLYEMKPNKKSAAHTSNDFAELVCSNSLKSNALTNACGLLKEEMRRLDSLVIEAADKTRVEAGQALAVNRELFAKYITDKIKENENIEIIYEEVVDINNFPDDEIVVIATGPLTSDLLSKSIMDMLGQQGLYFYDAAAPIVTKESLDLNKVYRKDRYGEIGEGDYLNAAMTKEEYSAFYNLLINAESADRHDFDKLEFFEGCMPIEEMARRGEKTLTFGPLKPVGLERNNEDRPYAVLQLRAEDKEETMYNLVGFQTSLKFKEQEKVFRTIPGLENAEFVRYGVMHRNTYINSPKVLDDKFNMINKPNVYFAGQISGVEGYVESTASGLMVAYNIIQRLKGKEMNWNETTMLGSLAKHVSTENKDYQPMNANFGIIKPLDKKIKDKKLKYEEYAKRSLIDIEVLKNEFKGS